MSRLGEVEIRIHSLAQNNVVAFVKTHGVSLKQLKPQGTEINSRYVTKRPAQELKYAHVAQQFLF